MSRLAASVWPIHASRPDDCEPFPCLTCLALEAGGHRVIEADDGTGRTPR